MLITLYVKIELTTRTQKSNKYYVQKEVTTRTPRKYKQ